LAEIIGYTRYRNNRQNVMSVHQW